MEKFLIENPTTFVTILLVVLIWTLPWKGWALWRSARRGNIGWFIVLLLVNTLAIVDILYIFIFSRYKRKEKQSDPISKPEKMKNSFHDLQKPKMIV